MQLYVTEEALPAQRYYAEHWTPVYLKSETDAALAAKDAEIAALKADAARLDKLPQCFHMLRTLPGDGLAGWWLSYVPNNVYSSVREAIDAHVDPSLRCQRCGGTGRRWDAGGDITECECKLDAGAQP